MKNLMPAVTPIKRLCWDVSRINRILDRCCSSNSGKSGRASNTIKKSNKIWMGSLNALCSKNGDLTPESILNNTFGNKNDEREAMNSFNTSNMSTKQILMIKNV